MYTFLLVVLVVLSLVVIAAVLLQSGKGQGLSASFGGASSSPDAFIGMRQAGNLLTQISWWGGGAFLALAFILQIMSTRNRVPRSILEGRVGQPPPAAPAGTGAGPLTPAPVAPAVPLTPAPAAGTAPQTSQTPAPGAAPAPTRPAAPATPRAGTPRPSPQRP